LGLKNINVKQTKNDFSRCENQATYYMSIAEHITG
jgi:hypothetical protein